MNTVKQWVLRVSLMAMVVVGLQVAVTPAPAPADEGVTAAGSADEPGASKRDGATLSLAKPARYRPRPGVTFNDPYSRPSITRNKIIEAINHTPRGEIIRIMTWSFYDSKITNALIRAHKRGVALQFFMSRGLSTDASGGSNFRRLKRELRSRPQPRAGYRSWARTCSNSCRGRAGAMHFKWITFSKTGIAKHVVMQGSANLNIRASFNQWNDWYTFVGRKPIFDVYKQVFNQSRADRPFPAITKQLKNTTLWFSPRGDDPVRRLLDATRCTGVRGAGRNGRTVIRIAVAVISGKRGEAIAKRLRTLDRQGCDIRLVYTKTPAYIRDVLSGIPIRQLAFDRNEDGLYDDYLHLKTMAISGRVGNDRGASVVLNGSANWSPLGLISDEQGTTIRGARLTRQYLGWIERVYGKGFVQGSARYRVEVARAGGVDPYANVELD